MRRDSLPLGERIPAHEYHHGTEWAPLLSSSRFKPFYTSPSHFRHPVKHDPSQAMNLGTMVHAAILEPGTLTEHAIMLPEWGWRSKEEKALWCEFAESHGANIESTNKAEIMASLLASAEQSNKLLLTRTEADQVRDMVASVYEHPICSPTLTQDFFPIYKEMSFRAGNPPRKARPDMLSATDDGLWITDLKVTGLGISPQLVRKQMWPEQAAWYELVLSENDHDVAGWGWFVIGTNPDRDLGEDGMRYPVHVFYASEVLREVTTRKLLNALDRYDDCVANNHWPTEYPEPEEIYPLCGDSI